MIYKARTIPRELEVYQLLNSRKNLLDNERKHLYALQKGYEGELLFDNVTSSVTKAECLILNDLLLPHNKNTFQIDSLIIVPETIYIVEVKNFEGDYFFEKDRLYTSIPPHSEITNPLIQLNRSESLFRQLLQQLGSNMTIQSYVVFVNPEFTLYQAPIIKQIVYPGQINKFLKSISPISLRLDNNHYLLADKLKSLHNPNAPFYFPPTYQYDELQKGIPCSYCDSLEFTTKGSYCYCSVCSKKETMEKRILRIVQHFAMLFPEMKITTNAIFDWGSGKLAKRVIRRVLQQHLNTKGVHQWSYYEF
ncbi:NERD domain-containing protein [Sutcliffiella horikoshii]|uniref:NERD domain-containing protein n=1 Tax=Sutcliffiella horikoshii TaxID=79883 RepID=A0A5D4SIP3_9BACI|nr:nuclease-related domain-containing protein [Sutcliffiella horikoshii]TYS62571.1 NERD domain-containing protein [Sutcliffiella horikoshii]